jgi:thiamine biosynthesis lipoprotein
MGAVTAEQLYEATSGERLHASGDYYRLSFRALGTVNQLLFSARSRAVAEAFRESALRWVAGFEARYSRFLPDSLVSAINDAAGQRAVKVDAETEQIFALCDWFHWKTGGVFDPTEGPLIRLWDYNRQHTRLPTRDEVEQARMLTGWRNVVRENGAVFLPRRGMSLDLGGIGKEYAVDRLCQMAIEAGLPDAMIDLGHDIRVYGQPPEKGPWRIGLERPDAPGSCWCGVALRQIALCCSGSYQRYFELNGRRYSHLIDPRSGYPVDNGCRAVWAIAPTCTEAGVLSTAAFALGAEEGLRLIESTHNAGGCLWTDHGLYQARRFQEHVLQDQPIPA